MSCTHPLLAVDNGLGEDGKKKIKVLTRIDSVNSIEEAIEKYQVYGKRNLIMLPCGKCPACRLKRRKEWSVRCQMEAKYHKKSCFVTLTYDNKHYPGHLDKDHPRKFIKALRNAGINVRYFGCGEYGSDPLRGHRGHYHVILFGYCPDDLTFFCTSKSGYPQYTSRSLKKFWKKGIVTVSVFAPEQAGYVAGYVEKKLKEDEGIVEDVPEFFFMSTRPGIGRQYVEDHVDDLLNCDSLVTTFGSHKMGLPRYFDKVAEKIGFDQFLHSLIKDERAEVSNIATFEAMRDHQFTTFQELFDYQVNDYKERIKFKKRCL